MARNLGSSQDRSSLFRRGKPGKKQLAKWTKRNEDFKARLEATKEERKAKRKIKKKERRLERKVRVY